MLQVASVYKLYKSYINDVCLVTEKTVIYHQVDRHFQMLIDFIQTLYKFVFLDILTGFLNVLLSKSFQGLMMFVAHEMTGWYKENKILSNV